MWTVPSQWNVPYRFRSVRILHHDRLEELIGEKTLTFRVGKRPEIFFGTPIRFVLLIRIRSTFHAGDRVQFEKDCAHLTLTMNEFLRWVHGEDHTALNDYSREEFFAYADYMHLPELFGEENDPLIEVDSQVTLFS